MASASVLLATVALQMLTNTTTLIGEKKGALDMYKSFLYTNNF
jgi:hypothetical protein